MKMENALCPGRANVIFAPELGAHSNESRANIGGRFFSAEGVAVTATKQLDDLLFGKYRLSAALNQIEPVPTPVQWQWPGGFLVLVSQYLQFAAGVVAGQYHYSMQVFHRLPNLLDGLKDVFDGIRVRQPQVALAVFAKG